MWPIRLREQSWTTMANGVCCAAGPFNCPACCHGVLRCDVLCSLPCCRAAIRPVSFRWVYSLMEALLALAPAHALSFERCATARDDRGLTVLHLATMFRMHDLIQRMCDRGADVNAAQASLSSAQVPTADDPWHAFFDGSTPLFYAASNMDPIATKLLGKCACHGPSS